MSVEVSDVLVRNKLKIRKHQMRSVSSVFYSGNQTEAAGSNIYRLFTEEDGLSWERVLDLSEYLVKHSYSQKVDEVQGDAYIQLCAFGQQEEEEAEIKGESTSNAATAYSSRRVVGAVCCHTIEVPDTVFEANSTIEGGVDIDTLMFNVVGDQWLTHGCYVAVFLSDDEHPPVFAQLIGKMNTPGAEKMGENCWAGWVGGTSTPTESGSIRYLRTNVICDSGPSRDHGIKEKLLFKIHDWALNDYDEAQGRYILKKYVHIMLFLTEEQYTTERDNWMEGSAIVNLSSIAISFTNSVAVPLYLYDLCGLSHISTGGSTKAVDLQGGVFSLVNIFRMTDSQAASLKKDFAEACVFSSIETAISRIQTPNAVYGLHQYPPITASGFDFYTVGVGGSEYMRIGCIDENAMSFNTNTPLPSVYGLLIGYPINPGFIPNSYDKLIFTDGVDSFSGCIRLQVVVYGGIHNAGVSTNGGSYGYGTNIEKSKFDAEKFFEGRSNELILETGEVIPIYKLYSAYHTEIHAGQEFVFGSSVKFARPGFLLIGVSPVEFSKEGSMQDGEWGDYSPPEYKSQYMQLVDWPISQTVKVNAIE